MSISETAQLVVLKDGRPESLRLAEVEFPQKGQPNARAARAFANRLALGHEVFVEESRLGDGRRVGYVTLPGGRNLSAELVKAGFAWPSSQQAGRLAGSLATLELRAMSDRRGMWGAAPTKPLVRASRATRAPGEAGDTASLRTDDAQGGDSDEAVAADDTTVDSGAAALGEN